MPAIRWKERNGPGIVVSAEDEDAAAEPWEDITRSAAGTSDAEG
jgi:hypothetical protein